MPSPKRTAAPPPWQTWATVLIILHFFCLAIGLAVNIGGGKSLIGQSLRKVPVARQYLQLLLMDMGYDFHLAGVAPDDGVHRLQLRTAELGAEGELLDEFPGETVSRIRRQRYQQLAFHVAYFDELFKENADLRTQLPLEIAERWVKDLDLPQDPYVLQCRRLPSKRLPRAIAADVTYAYVMREGGLAQQVVEEPPPPPINIRLVWDPLESRYQGSRQAPLGERAEVVRTSSSPSKGEAGRGILDGRVKATATSNDDRDDRQSLP